MTDLTPESPAVRLYAAVNGIFDDENALVNFLGDRPSVRQHFLTIAAEHDRLVAEHLAPVVAERDAAIAERERLRDALTELLEVARLRGDDELPHPANDAKLWTARMQTAWDEARAALNPEAKS